MGALRLAALDVDGTLVDTQKRVSAAVIRAVDALIDAGVEPVIATGRTLSELDGVLSHWPRIRYCILANGACVMDLAAGVCLHADRLPVRIARDILLAAKDMDVMAGVYADNTVYTEKRRWDDAGRYHAAYLRDTLPHARTPVPDMDAFLSAREADVDKVEISFHDARDLPRLHKACAKLGVARAVSIHGELEINHPDASKGRALAALCGLLGIDAADAAALGDSETDIPMLRYVGLPIAMGNASQAVRECARRLVADNDHDGAAAAIRSYMLQ